VGSSRVRVRSGGGCIAVKPRRECGRGEEGGGKTEGGRGGEGEGKGGEKEGGREREEVGKGGRGRPNTHFINMAISRYMILTFCALATKYAGLWGGSYTTVQADGALQGTGPL